MTTNKPDLDHHRLETNFYDTTYNPVTNIAVKTKPIEGQTLGSGHLVLSHKEGGQLSAVKRVPRGVEKVDLLRTEGTIKSDGRSYSLIQKN